MNKQRFEPVDCESDVEMLHPGVSKPQPSTKRFGCTYANCILTLLTIGVLASLFVADPMSFSGSVPITPGNGDGSSVPAPIPTPEPTIEQLVSQLLPGSIDLSVQPMQLRTGSIGATYLPGSSLMSKAYNMFHGSEVFEQSGRDIIDFTFTDSNLNKRWVVYSGSSYIVPWEYASVPNMMTSCDIFTEVDQTTYSSSTQTLRNDAFKYDMKIGAQIKMVKLGITHGQSWTSKNRRKKTREGKERSFSGRASTTMYQAEIDWNGDTSGFQWKTDFTNAVTELNANPTNKTILAFINTFGSHVVRKMEAGAFCEETVYVSNDNTGTETEILRTNAWNAGFEVGVKHKNVSVFDMSMDLEGSNSYHRTGTTDNGAYYERSDIKCYGEVANTAGKCATWTATASNPIITKHSMMPIWEIEGVEFTQETRDAFAQFELQLEESMEQCRLQICDDKGICPVNEALWDDQYIADWDGASFDIFWDLNGDCFCSSAPTDYCATNSTLGCECAGDKECCCNADNSCNEDLICKPAENQNECIAQDSTIDCGGLNGHIALQKKATFLQCTQGVVIGSCGSGENADCSGSVCPSGSYNGMKCAYPELGNENSHQWMCSQSDGGRVNCPSDKPIMTGLCGSGKGRLVNGVYHGNCDDSDKCSGWVGAKCTDIEGVSVNEDSCKLMYQWDWGKFVECPDGYVATGFCGSGGSNGLVWQSQKRCDGAVSTLRCCKLNYD